MQHKDIAILLNYILDIYFIVIKSLVRVNYFILMLASYQQNSLFLHSESNCTFCTENASALEVF